MIEAILSAAFPERPIPKTFFRGSEGLTHDWDLAARIEGRAWTSLSILDWRMIGATPAAYREYMVPETFAYYVPSYLLGVIAEPGFRDLALEAILPNNRRREPRGEWWGHFAAAFTGAQRAALRAFVAFQKDTVANDPGAAELVEAAERVWAQAAPDLR